MNRLLFFLVIYLAMAFPLAAQEEARINRQAAWKDVCYDTHIRSIQLFKGDNEQSLPALVLNAGERLTLWFDDLSEQRSSLRYTIVHCSADWEEDNLFITDYLEGFAENRLNDFKHSHITRVNYTHYELQIPNSDVQLKVSGNYLLKVYETDAKTPAFVRGFSVVSPASAATLRMRGPAVTGESCLQQLEFAVNHPSLEVRNAFRELKVRVEQNGYRLPLTPYPTPAFTDIGRTDYSQADRNWYPGGNEFRFFDTRNLDFSGRGVVQIRKDSDGFVYALLQPDAPRNRQYSYEREMNGRFYIDAYRTADRLTEADYITTIFTLNAPEPFDGEVYVFGAFTGFALHPAFRMEYNAERQAYELNTLVKQGLYNYRYVLLDRQGRIDWTAIEGCYAETENSYHLYVYFRSARDRYDRLVGLFSATIN
ncbi:MAG: DUF5103 domain-containing protein [Prevotellaceae bacterium]|jgi:hypothetical protein|nr:DUF5103 domain-containing protein [Prevotellaceae bacterium]